MIAVAVQSCQSRSTFPAQPRAENNFSDGVARLLGRIDYRLADSTEQREAIFRLRYEAYMREGTISANAARTFSDRYDETDNCYLFGVYIDDELAGSMRVHVASKQHPDFPSLQAFHDVLQPKLNAGKVIIDSTRFVADERLSRRYRGLPYATVRLSWLAAEYFAAEHLLAAVRAEHQAFYRRVFHHRPICEPRPYPQLAKPICLMTIHYRSVADDVHRRYPFFRSTLFERRMLFERSVAGASNQLSRSRKHVTAMADCDAVRQDG